MQTHSVGSVGVLYLGIVPLMLQRHDTGFTLKVAGGPPLLPMCYIHVTWTFNTLNWSCSHHYRLAFLRVRAWPPHSTTKLHDSLFRGCRRRGYIPGCLHAEQRATIAFRMGG